VKPIRPIASLILDMRGRRVIIDADLAAIYGVETRVLNQAVKRNRERFPGDFVFSLSAIEKEKVITNCDHLAHLRFARSLPLAFTEHGAIMAATVLNSPRAVAMSVYVVRAFVRMREQLASNTAILKRLAEIDRTLLQHDASLRDIYRKLLPLLRPPLDPPRRRIGFTGND
jgi:hypothetical protein